MSSLAILITTNANPLDPRIGDRVHRVRPDKMHAIRVAHINRSSFRELFIVDDGPRAACSSYGGFRKLVPVGYPWSGTAVVIVQLRVKGRYCEEYEFGRAAVRQARQRFAGEASTT